MGCMRGSYCSSLRFLMRRIAVHATAIKATDAAMTMIGTTTLVVPSLPEEEPLLLARLTPVAAALAALDAAPPFRVAAAALAAASALACDSDAAGRRLAEAAEAEAEAAAIAELTLVGAAAELTLAAAACGCEFVLLDPRLLPLLWLASEPRLPPLVLLLLLLLLELDELVAGRF